MPRSSWEPGIPVYAYGDKNKYEVCELTGCWIWMGAWNLKSRRGKVRNDKGKPVEAYVYFFEKRFGKVPPGLMVAHTCENSICVNPSHLVASESFQNCPVNQWHSEFWRSLSDLPF